MSIAEYCKRSNLSEGEVADLRAQVAALTRERDEAHLLADVRATMLAQTEDDCRRHIETSGRLTALIRDTAIPALEPAKAVVAFYDMWQPGAPDETLVCCQSQSVAHKGTYATVEPTWETVQQAEYKLTLADFRRASQALAKLSGEVGS